MSLFFNYRDYETIFPIILPTLDTSDYKTLSESQVISSIGMYLRNTQRILSDSVSLINNTDNLDVYFKRFEMVVEILKNWSLISECNMQYFKSGNPKNDYEQVINSETKNQRNAVDRYIDKEKKTIASLSTEKGRMNKYNKMIELLTKNIENFTPENQKYINEIINSKKANQLH